MEIKPRAYQQAIFETAKKYNTLVVLPTGLGKTLIAVLLAKHRLEEFPNSKVLFLAPTRPLAAQQAEYFSKYLNHEIHLLTGRINPEKRAEIWKRAQIIFSTPQCIENDIKNNLISLHDVSLLIEDEAHRCLKNYSYTFVAKAYREQALNKRILGLTASPGSDLETIKEICQNLGIEKVEVRTRYSKDVRSYIQKLTLEIVKVELPEKIREVREKIKKIYDKKIEELKNRKLLDKEPTKKELLDLQARLQREIAKGSKDFNILRGLSACAKAIKLQYLIELIETQGVESAYNYMQELYEQARKKTSKAVMQIINSKEFQDAYLCMLKLIKDSVEHPKLMKLKEIVSEEMKKNPELRMIVFSQYRESVAKINKELRNLGIKSEMFIGQAKKKDYGMSQKEQQRILNDFRKGKLNCLVSTSVGEEGLDIPEVDVVIFYEPIPSAIRKVQRAGRTARLRPGKLIILLTKGTVDESYHWAAWHKERKMYKLLDELRKDLKSNFHIKTKKQKSLTDFSL